MSLSNWKRGLTMRTDAKITNRIERQVLGHKQVAFKALLMLDAIEALVKRHEGKKIYNATGYMSKAFEADYKTVLGSFNLANSDRFRFDKSYEYLYLKWDFWVTWGNYLMSDGSISHADGEYYKISPYLGRITNGVLSSKDEVFTEIKQTLEYYLNQDYATVKTQLDEIKEAEEALRLMKTKLPSYVK